MPIRRDRLTKSERSKLIRTYGRTTFRFYHPLLREPKAPPEFLPTVRQLEKLDEWADDAYKVAICERKLENFAVYGSPPGKPPLRLSTRGNFGRLVGLKDSDVYNVRPPADDHGDLWLLEGKPYCYVSHPYSFDLEDMQATLEFCRKYRLTVRLSACSYYNPGDTHMLVYKKAEAGR